MNSWNRIFFFLAAPLPALAGALIFLQAPPLETLQDSSVTWKLAAAPGQSVAFDSCGVYSADIPIGSQLSGHAALSAVQDSALSQPPSLQLVFTPSQGNAGPQLSLGVHYLVAACQDGSSVSSEIPLRVVTAQGPVILTPQAEITSTPPEITWTPVPGVPAYHLLLSDQPLQIDANAGTVSGASIIWQAIVTGNRIAYGDPDPSGNFSKVAAPPLAPGVEYNLAILDNYDGKTALNTSTKAQSLRLFTLVAAAHPLPAPTGLQPLRGAAFQAPADSQIHFRWTSSSAGGQSANTYSLYVYAAETQSGVQVLRPIWQNQSTDTTALLPAKGVLLNGRYVYKVFALAADGSGTVSDTTSFTYSIPTQTLRLGARNVAAGDTAQLANVGVTVTALDGSGTSLPLFTLSDDLLSVNFALGQYHVTFATAGYDPVTLNATLSTAAAVSLNPVLSASPSRITGIAADTLGQALSNVSVTAVGSDGLPVLAQSDAQGHFLLGVHAGATRLSWIKDDYQERDTSFITVNGAVLDLGTITLQKAVSLLSGTVRTSAGAPLATANVTVSDSNGALLRNLLTDAQGNFSLFLSRGTYQVAASRTGYAGQTQTVSLANSKSLNFILTPGASVVNVHVLQVTLLAAGDTVTAPLQGATVVLRPLSGGVSVTGNTDVNGAAALSLADTGTFWLWVADPETYPDSQRVKVPQPKSTVTGELRPLRYASVSGRLRLLPDTAVDPTRLQVSLLPAGGGTAVASATTTLAATSDTLGRFAFTLDRVPAGSFSVTCGLPGYSLDSQAVISVIQGRSVDSLSLTLRRTTAQASFLLQRAGSNLPGTVTLRAPFSETFAAGQKQPLGSGTFLLDAAPQDSTVLPLRGYQARLTGAAGIDTTVTLIFPATRNLAGISVTNGLVALPYNLDTNANAGAVAYSSRAGSWDTLRLAAAALQAGADTAYIPAPAQGGNLSYAFSFHFGNRVYGQGATDAPYLVAIPRDTTLSEITLAEGDSLLLPANSNCRVTVRTHSAAGDPLDAGVAAKGQVRFRLSAHFPGVVSSTLGPSALLHANQAPSPKTTAQAAKTGAATWDTLEVTVTYAGHTLTSDFFLRAVSFTADILRLTSQLGDIPLLSAPQAVALQVTAYDTSTVPPTPLLANPDFVVQPAEAGAVVDGVLQLDTAFLGPVNVFARETRADGTLLQAELFQDLDSSLRAINVGQTLRPGAAARRFFYTNEVEVDCPDSAFPKGVLLRLVPHSMPRTFASLRTSALQGPAYELSNPNAAALAYPLEIRVSPPLSRNPLQSILQRYDASLLTWFDLSDTGRGTPNLFGKTYVSARVSQLDGQYYGLFSASEPLGLSDFEIIPNPFSPRVTAVRDGNTQPGARILFRPEADSSAEVTVSLKIYNQAGEPVRTLVNYKTYPKTEVEVYWDGLDDRGRRVRNGRYLLSATLTPTGGGRTRSLAKPIVVFE